MADNETPEPIVVEQVGQGEGAEGETLDVELTAEEAQSLEGLAEEALPTERTYTHKEVAGLQRRLNQINEENRQLRTQEAYLKAIEARMAHIEEGLVIGMDSPFNAEPELYEPNENASIEQTPLQKRRRDWETRGKQIPTPEQIGQQEAGTRFASALSRAKIDLADEDSIAFFSKLSGPEEALDRLPEFISQREKSAIEVRAADIKKAVDAAMAERDAKITTYEAERTKLGLGTVDTGMPSASGRRQKTPYEVNLEVIKELKGEA